MSSKATTSYMNKEIVPDSEEVIRDNAKWGLELVTIKYLPILKEAQNGDWVKLRKHLDDGDIQPYTIISMFSDNIIHVLVCLGGRGSTALLESIVDKPDFQNNILLQTNIKHNTALFLAAMVGNTEAAMIIVQKAPEALTISDLEGTFPVYVAARLGHKETTRFLIQETRKRSDHNFNHDYWGVLLLNLLISAGFYDMANELLDAYPELAYGNDMNGTNPLQTFSNRPLSGHHCGTDEEIHSDHTLAQTFRFIVKQIVPIRPPPRVNLDALKLIRRICEATCLKASTGETAASDYLWAPLLKATQLGTYEIVAEIIDACPYIVWFTDGYERTIFHYAVIHRHERIFNLLWKLGANRHRIAAFTSTNGTNILHLAGLLGKSTANRISGAALQMQRELQWFKEVEKLAQVSFQDKEIDIPKDDKKKHKVGGDDMRKEEIDEYKDLRGTPKTVFTDQHKNLVKEGTEWMKTTAAAYSIVNALMFTVLFAAAFTVPGGTTDKTGVLNFLHKPSFIVFSLFKSIGFFSSSTSLLMFLGILTSRYSQNDFLFFLPMKLVIGLSALFLSMVCMLVAFSTTLYVYLEDLGKGILLPIILCACGIFCLFFVLQFPLLSEVFYATFFNNIFCHESKSSFKTNPSDGEGPGGSRPASSRAPPAPTDHVGIDPESQRVDLEQQSTPNMTPYEKSYPTGSPPSYWETVALDKLMGIDHYTRVSESPPPPPYDESDRATYEEMIANLTPVPQPGTYQATTSAATNATDMNVSQTTLDIKLEEPSTETNDVIVDNSQQFEDEDIEARRQLKGKTPAEDQRREEEETSNSGTYF